MSSNDRIWKTSDDGLFVWMTMTPDRIPAALEVMRHGFIPYECAAIGLMLSTNERATNEFLNICGLIAKDGASLVVVHAPSDKVVGVAFNKIQTKPKEGEPSFLDLMAAKYCSDSASIAILNFMADMDDRVDVFEHYGVTSLLEHMFLAVLPDFCGNKLGNGLVQSTEDMAVALRRGEVVVENKSNTIELVLALFTSRFSQRVGQSRNWEELVRVGHDQFSFEGKTFSERIGPEHPDNLLMAKRLDVP